MRVRYRLLLSCSLLLALLVACTNPNKPQTSSGDEHTTITHVHRTEPAPLERPKVAPRRIILMIGDGMGVPAISSASYVKGKPLNMLEMPTISFMRTHEHEFVTTDSAASATAFATGSKTHYEGVSVTPGTTQKQETDPAHKVETLVEVAQEAGLRTGLVATSRIVHATPAAFASHRANRSSYEEIALDMSAAKVDVLLGSGSRYFMQRKDRQNLFDEMTGQGYRILDTPEALQEARAADAFQPTVGLLHEKDMPMLSDSSTKRAESLATLTGTAIDLLDKQNPEGFFLMVEGSFIDWEEHAMNGPGTIAETIDFDEAVGVARAYAAQRDDTLVIVTADHETGGLATLDPYTVKRPLDLLGGMDAAKKLVAGADVDFPDPVMFQPLGIASGDPDKTFGPPLVEDPQIATTFGYMSVASRKGWKKEQSYFSASHTATMVPIFAQGTSAEAVTSIHDNADLGDLLKTMLRAQDPYDITKGLAARARQLSGTPKNVILIVGDGMGIAALTAAYYTGGKLSTLEMPVQGLVSTHGADRLVNDSAATATALATGHRAMYRSVGMRPGKTAADPQLPSVSVIEEAERRGLRTGIITTTTLTHATPAAFFAHHEDRKQEADIAKFFMDMPERIEGSDGVDVAFAGGAKYFTPKMIEELEARGVIVSKDWTGEMVPGFKKVLRLLADGGLPGATERMANKAGVPGLFYMIQSALFTLSDDNDRGFFLLVEGGQIDWKLHGLDTSTALIDEILDLDNAVSIALSYAKEHGDTLVIVTADHDHTVSILDNHYGFESGHCSIAKRCGGEVEFEEILARGPYEIHRGRGFGARELQGEFEAPRILLQYAWPVQAASRIKRSPGPHSANFVPLFAFGPGADRFTGFHDQPEVGQKLISWARGEFEASTP